MRWDQTTKAAAIARYARAVGLDGGAASGQSEMAIAPHDPGGLARKRASEPLRPKAPQAACDLGLFGDGALQSDLVDLARKA
jgi:hypothetical protein